ncbi:CHFR [Branchiostoma lanceolatum]|uniref:E3 ubiquitin-protein ligase CHFR n=1 Tax=Branchiostoma lanceolatum TaxID=7740 RepID=A0A8J9YNV7_BRALA|nr:CHFR [Branchiostoma lanceolatum]
MSAEAEGREPWAQLVSTTDVDSPPVSINKDRFTIGRRAGDMTFPENKLVSSSHCSLIREPTTGKVFLQDTSTNGTMINNTKVGKGQKWELNHGDEIHIVFKKNNTEQNIAYLFQDLARLKEEENASLLDITQDYGSDTEGSTIDYTLPNTELGSEASNASGASGAAKRQLEEFSESEPVPKKPREETKPDAAVAASATGGVASTSAAEQGTKDAEKEDTTLKREDSQVAGPSSDKGAAASKDVKPKPPPRDEMEETLLCGVCQDILHDCISLQPCMHSFCAGCYSQWMDMSNLCPSCRNKVDRISKNHIVNNLVQVYLKDHPEKKRSEEDLAELNKKNKITDDMLYPKHGHHRREYESYSDEYSDSDSGHEDASLSGGSTPRGWRAYYNPYGMHHVSSRPPPRTICRQCPDYAPSMAGIAAAQVTGTLVTPPVSTGIASSPVRMGEEITLYDPRVVGPTVVSTVTQVVQPPPTGVASVPAPVSVGQGISMYDPRILGTTPVPPATDPGGSQTSGVVVSSTTPAPGAAVPTTTRTDSSVSTSSQSSQDRSPEERARRLAGPCPPPPEPCQFVCQVNQNHVMCQCCWKPMPDRTRETPPSPPQKCTLCHRVFCHMYWGCNNPRCLGCLNNFKDLYFDGRCLNDLINNNYYESSIFMTYLDDKNLTLRDVLQKCMEKLEAGEYTVTDPNARPTSPVTPDTVICYTCGLRNFRQLAYQYRKHIQPDQLPAEATSRPDCYWGRNCRTQHSKPHHAKNFSHICEQTRFT